MKYAAIDFETANYERASACSLGIVISDGTKVTDRWHHLIRPPKMLFELRPGESYPAGDGEA